MTRRNHSFRLDAGIIDKIEAHRERLQRKVGEAIKITARAALEDLVLQGVLSCQIADAEQRHKQAYDEWLASRCYGDSEEPRKAFHAAGEELEKLRKEAGHE